MHMMRRQNAQERYEEEQRSGSTRLLGEAELERARWLDSQRSGRRSARRAQRALRESGRRRYGDEPEESGSSDGWVTDEPDETGPGYQERREPRRDARRTSPSGRRSRGAALASNTEELTVLLGRQQPEAWEATVSSRGHRSEGALALRHELSGLKLLALHARALQDGGARSCMSWVCQSPFDRVLGLTVLGVSAAVSEAAVEEAMEAEAPKPALIALVVDHHAAAAKTSRRQRHESRRKVDTRHRRKGRPGSSSRRREQSATAAAAGGDSSPVNARSRTPGTERSRRQHSSRSPASLGRDVAAAFAAGGSRQVILEQRGGHSRRTEPELPSTHLQLHAPGEETARERARVFLGAEW